MKFKKQVLTLFAAILLSFTMFGCNGKFISDNDIATMVRLINNEQVSDALRLYNNKIVKNMKKNEKASDELSNLINGVLDKYDKQEYDFSTAYDKIDELGEFSCVSNDAEAALTKLILLNDSKNAYIDGQHYFEQADYPEAIKAFKKVSPEYKYYEDAKIKIKEAEELYNIK